MDSANGFPNTYPAFLMTRHIHDQAPVVQTLDSAIHWINHILFFVYIIMYIDKIEHYTINLNISKLKIAVNYELIYLRTRL